MQFSSLNRRPYTTSVGLVTALGTTTRQTWDALQAGRYITDHQRVPLNCQGRLCRASTLAVQAAREAIQGRPSDELAMTALVVGTSKGPVGRWLNSHNAAVDRKLGPLGLGEVATDVAEALNIDGPRLTVSCACSSGLVALIRAAMLIDDGTADRVLVVATEASVHPLFLGSFARLGVLARSGAGCRPFDVNRSGFLISEAAAAVMLDTSPAPGALAIEAFAMGADATHLTGADPHSAALRNVLRRVVSENPLDLVHAHGTATPMNDALELAAIESQVRLQSQPPILYSHKAALGHSLGAAGLVAVVINLLCHRHGLVPPNVLTRQPQAMEKVQLSSCPVSRAINRSLVLAAGFGGPVAALSLQSDR